MFHFKGSNVLASDFNMLDDKDSCLSRKAANTGLLVTLNISQQLKKITSFQRTNAFWSSQFCTTEILCFVLTEYYLCAVFSFFFSFLSSKRFSQ